MNTYNEEKKNCVLHIVIASLLSIIISLISFMILKNITDKIIASLIGLEVVFWLYNPIRHLIQRFNIFKSSKFRKELHARFMMMLSNTCTLLHILVIIKNPEFFLTALSFMWVLGIWIMLFDGMTSLSNL